MVLIQVLLSVPENFGLLLQNLNNDYYYLFCKMYISNACQCYGFIIQPTSPKLFYYYIYYFSLHCFERFLDDQKFSNFSCQNIFVVI